MSEGEKQELARREEICSGELEILPVSEGWTKDGVDEENQAGDVTELSTEIRKSIERDFEILKRVTNIDRDLLYSLLLSQINNSKRLETIMGDLFSIPDEVAIINDIGRNNYNEKKEETKTRGCTAKFLMQIREMFPNADVSFLAQECQSLDTEEDCARFIDTVMLSGDYPKRDLDQEVHRSTDPNSNGDKAQISDEIPPRSVIYSSSEEISSSGMIESRYSHRKRRKTRALDWFYDDAGPSTSRNFLSVENAKKDADRDISDFITRFFPESEILPSFSPKDDRMLEKTQNLVLNPPNKSDACRTSERNLLVKNSSGSTVNPNFLIMDSEMRVHNKDELPSTSWTKTESRKNGNHQLNSWNFGEDNLEVTTTSISSEDISETGADEDFCDEWMNEQTAELIRLFPNTDPSFLREECVKFRGSVEAMNEFVISKLERNDMPSRADYEKRQELAELQNRYTSNFSIEDFLKVIPDPWTYFSSPNRNCAKYKLHSLIFLKSAFRKIYSHVITSTLMKNNFNLYLSYKELKQKSPTGRIRGRSNSECVFRPAKIDIQFLQEAAFIRNEEKIRDFIKSRELEKKLRFEEAKRRGNLLECQCCYDSEIMVEDIVCCPRDHPSCKLCVIKYVEVEMGQAKYQFPCLAGCGENYTLIALQNVVKPELFSKIIQANQMEEIQAAGIEDLVQCPFCNYATIMPPEVKVLPCLNPECQKESCRLCKELSHIPLRCDEVEKSEEVRMRTYIENKMTEALVRTCYKCGKAFVKEEGCNKMVCRCGAKMCYVCRKPVTGYSHFNGQGGTEYEKCPLYSTNDELHVDLVQRVAEEAKAEILGANPDKELKHDPTMLLPERTYDLPMVGMNPGAAVTVGLMAFRQLHNGPEEQRPAAENNVPVAGQGRRNEHRQLHRHRR